KPRSINSVRNSVMSLLTPDAFRRSAARRISSFTGTTTFSMFPHLLQMRETLGNHTPPIARTHYVQYRPGNLKGYGLARRQFYDEIGEHPDFEPLARRSHEGQIVIRHERLNPFHLSTQLDRVLFALPHSVLGKIS